MKIKDIKTLEDLKVYYHSYNNPMYGWSEEDYIKSVSSNGLNLYYIDPPLTN